MSILVYGVIIESEDRKYYNFAVGMVNFNEYNQGLDTEQFKDFIKSKGKKVRLERGGVFSSESEIPSRLGWVDRGALRYSRINPDGREYNVGFSFVGEAVVDYFSFILGTPSEVNVTAITGCELTVVSKKQFLDFQQASVDNLLFIKTASESLGNQMYKRLMSLYTDSPEERYKELMRRCSDIFDIIALKEISSFLGVTPETVSHIRRRLLK